MGALDDNTKIEVEKLLRRCKGQFEGLIGRAKTMVEMMGICIAVGLTVCGGAIASTLRGKADDVGDVDVDLDACPEAKRSFYGAFNMLDQHMHGPFPETWPDAYDTGIAIHHEAGSFTDVQHRGGTSVRDILYEKDGQAATVQLVQ